MYVCRLTYLLDTIPLDRFGAAIVSFPVAPKISFDIRMAGGEITQMPWLRTEIVKAMQKAIAEEFLWPKRAVIPSPAAPSAQPRPMLSAREIQDLSSSDPLLRAEQKLAANEIYQKTTLQREIPSEDSLRMDVLLKDETGEVREGGEAATEEEETKRGPLEQLKQTMVNIGNKMREGSISRAGTEKHDSKKGLGDQWKQLLTNMQSRGVNEGATVKCRRKKYGRKRDIVFSFNNPDAGDGDWVGIFRSGAVENGEIATNEFPVDWFYGE